MSAIGDDGQRPLNRPTDLDETDRQILVLLAGNARQSVREIARRIQMSPGAIADRVARMEERGVIRGYHTQIDPAALGFGLEAVVALQTEQGPSMEATLDRLMTIPEVEAAQVVTGPWDLIVRVRVRDHQHLRSVVFDKIWPIPGFRHSETMISYETRERSGGWNVALALDEATIPPAT
jgi:Lrp/AsnC family leucine-responsive transcriptional regulator